MSHNFNNESKSFYAWRRRTDAEGNKNSMISAANQYNYIIIAPKIDATNFPLGDQYNFGNVYKTEIIQANIK